MNLTTFTNAYDKIGQLTPMSFSDVASLPLEVKQDKLKCKLAFFGELENNSRQQPIKVISRNGIILDLDHNKVDTFERLTKALDGLQYIIYTTHSHNPDKNDYCYRVVIFTSEPVPAADYENVYWNCIEDNPELKKMSDEKLLDHSAKDVSRSYFLWSAHPDRELNAYMDRSDGGVPYKPNTQKRTVTENVSSNVPSVQETVVEGNRNVFLASEAGRLISLLKSEDKVRKELHAINAMRCSPPLAHQEVETIFKSIWSKHFIDHPEDKPITDAVPHRNSYTINEGMELPPVEWIVENLIEDNSMNAIYGDTGSTKSFLAIDLGMHMALGKDWFGLEVYREIPVIYVAVEGGGGLIRRITGWLKSNEGEETPSNFIIDRDVIKPADEDSICNFINYYKQKGFKNGMIFVDTLNANARASGLDEDNKSFGLVVDTFQRIKNELNSSYMVIHHTGKDASKGMRGGSTLPAALDTILYVEKKDSGCSWTIEKLKEGEDDKTYAYKTELVALGEDSHGKPITTLVIKAEGEVSGAKDTRVSFRGNQKAIWEFTHSYLMQQHSHRCNMDCLLDYIHEKWATHSSDKRRHDARTSLEQIKYKCLIDFGAWVDPDTKIKYQDQIWLTKKGIQW